MAVSRCREPVSATVCPRRYPSGDRAAPCPTSERVETVTPSSSDAEDEVAIEILDAGLARERHGGPELAAQDVERAGYAGRAVGGQAPQDRAPNRNHGGAEREALQHRRAAGEAAVHDDGCAPRHRIRDGRQRVDG